MSSLGFVTNDLDLSITVRVYARRVNNHKRVKDLLKIIDMKLDEFNPVQKGKTNTISTLQSQIGELISVKNEQVNQI